LPPTGDDVAEVGDRCFLTSPDGGEMDFTFLDPRRFFPPDCDACSQFHQHFISCFCVNIHLTKKLQSQSVITEKLWETLLYEKSAHKMLVKLTPAVLHVPLSLPLCCSCT